MRQWLAILADSLRESLDRRGFQVLLALTALVIAFSASISFVTLAPEQVLAEHAREIERLRLRAGTTEMSRQVGVDYEVSDPRPVTAADGLGEEFAGGFVLEYRFPRREALDELARAWREFRRMRAQRRAVPDGGAAAPEAIGEEERIEMLSERFHELGYRPVRVEALADAPAQGAAYRVAARPGLPEEIMGAHRMRAGFGLWEGPIGGLSKAELVVRIQDFLANGFAGMVGLLVALATTAGFLPGMLQKGTIELVLARPIGRGRLLLYKYLGGCGFILGFALLLFAGSWLGFAAGSGVANPWYLLCVLTFTLQFLILFSVTLPVAVLTRSGALSTLAALGVWLISSGVVNARRGLDLLEDGGPRLLRSVLDAAYLVLPKTTDIASLNTLFLARSALSEDAWERTFRGELPEVDWAWSLGTSAAFAAAMVLLGIWSFRRRDW